MVLKLFVNFLVTAPTAFVQSPTIIHIPVHIAMSIVIFIFSSRIFLEGWPSYNFCRLYSGYPDYKFLPEEENCHQARDRVRVMMGISGAAGIVIG